MNHGFTLNLDTNSYNYKSSGIETYKANAKRQVTSLAELMIAKDTFDASLILDKLFPTVKADIFLSHSFQDAEKAIQLAVELKEQCGLNVFVDSCVWGSVYELQNAIDRKYCFNESSNTYDYNKRNRSTAHLHMILSTALQRMIDETETILFMNTDQSISLDHSVNQELKTLSPWIHMELAFSSLVRRKKGILKKAFEDAALDRVITSESYTMVHDAPVSHLTSLSNRDFLEWMEMARIVKGSAAVQLLYSKYIGY